MKPYLTEETFIKSILDSRYASIAESFRKLATSDLELEVAKGLGLKKFPQLSELKSSENFNKLMSEGFKRQPFVPVFYETKNEIGVYQEEIFDVFALAKAFASYLRGIDQYPAATLLKREKYFQLATFAYYSSVFQLIDAFLTLYGTCIMPRPISGMKQTVVKTEEEGDKKSEIIKATPIRLEYECLLCKYDSESARWIFTPSNFKHENRWRWFCELLSFYTRSKANIPRRVVDFFGYLKVAEEYRQHRWEEQRRYSISFSDDEEFRRFIERSWRIIPRIRHDAIYQNAKYDIMERTYVAKGLYPPRELTDARMSIFQGFNGSMIKWTAKLIQTTIEGVRKALKDDAIFYKALNIVSENPLIEMVDLDYNRLNSSRELDEVSKLAKEIVALILPAEKVWLGDKPSPLSPFFGKIRDEREERVHDK